MSNYLLLQAGAQLFSLLVGFVSYRKKSVSVSGLLALLLISSLFIWLQHVDLLIILFLMFASSSFLTSYKKERKKEFEAIVEKTGPRDYKQALANLGVAAFLMLVNLWLKQDWLVAAFIGSVAAANADSWASEIGGLAKGKPVMITTFKPIDKGVSGGVSLPGTLGGIAGALFISILGLWSIHSLGDFSGNKNILFLSAIVSGILGFIVDSYLGAWFQPLYISPDKNLTESSVAAAQKIKGYNWLNNDMVNLMSTIIAAFIAALLYYLSA